MTAQTIPPGERDTFKIVAALRQAIEGRNNANGTVTLTANVTATTVSAPNCAATSGVYLTAATTNAAGALATTFVKTTDVTKGQFIVTHASTSTTDRTFFWVALG